MRGGQCGCESQAQAERSLDGPLLGCLVECGVRREIGLKDFVLVLHGLFL